MNLMESIFLSLFANIIRMYAIYRCMEHFFLSKDENKISKICIYIAEDANRDVFCGFFSSAYSHLVTIEIH